MALVAIPFACVEFFSRGLFVRGDGVPGADVLCPHDVLRAGVLGDTGYSGSEPAGAAMAIYFMAMYMCGASLGPLLTGKLSDVLRIAPPPCGFRHGHGNFPRHWPQQAMLIIPVLCIALAFVLYMARALHHGHSAAGKLSPAGYRDS